MRVGSSRTRGAGPARGSRGVEQRAVAWPGVQRARAAAEVPGHLWHSPAFEAATTGADAEGKN